MKRDRKKKPKGEPVDSRKAGRRRKGQFLACIESRKKDGVNLADPRLRYEHIHAAD